MAENPNKDGASIDPLPDGVSSLRWSPTANVLAATCWDGNAYVWDVHRADHAQLVALRPIGGPALCCAFSADGRAVYVGGCTPNPKAWDLHADTMTDVAVHHAPTKRLLQVPGEPNVICTGSWDGSVRYWDVRAPSSEPLLHLAVGDRVFCMDAAGHLLATALSGRRLLLYDLRKPGEELDARESPLKFQSRALACFPDQSGFALGSIEGRVAIQYLEDDKESRRNFAYKCHRKRRSYDSIDEVYPVSDIHFNVHGTFATAGSDGTVHIWDKDARQRLHAMKDCGQPVSACRFSADAQLLAYAVGYDWHKGAAGYDSAKTNRIYIHSVNEKEVKPRPSKRRR